ncbi:MAG: RNA-binding S4 domain-containing protein [Cyanobacteria bacterium P01_G01_bin.54]
MTDFIKLDQFLKLSGVVATGGQAKLMIQDGIVTVNGETETRRGKKLRAGDRVVVNGEEFVVALAAED